MKTSKSQDDEPATVVSNCACGKVSVRVQIPSQQEDGSVTAVDCHCPACRKFHVAAFGSYLKVPAESVQLGNVEDLQSYTETCHEVGPVERLFCRHCYTKVATKPQSAESDNSPATMLVNMGGLVDKTIPKAYQKAWSHERTVWQPSSEATWTNAKPRKRRGNQMPPLLTTSTGSCSCGKCQYQIHHVPYEMQHCYCKLCRQLCGSAYQSWIPVMNEDIVWNTTTNEGPILKRTTEHGKRHFCTTCGSCLTIVYDEQPDCTWPAAGGLDDASLPSTTEDMNLYLERVCHICCIWKQSWYALPSDGMERIKYAC
ncbi:Glutathione-dependent formaldehyde-activating enzyme [Seminavis robusta]|uniref:Glutathione-dependent formaldehyde-activating enzyme n=1 Tax=Seminavis robusta TaxID=568900 RepID=A0A9N8EPH7_9STRA|nr:Glutathione-dependent formaldehyde-activating enzyme [Seminavis robusta]|eukprot:Sro1600_g285010.1 Glutathione-dependent formaldehyde-activating enzyme (313) ;mRNA; r:4647-5585